MSSLQKQFKDQIKTAEEVESTRFWSTGNIGLDWLMSGGLPQRRSIEIWGEESGGKTTTALECARPYLKQGYKVFIVDAEGTITKDDWERLNLPVTKDNLTIGYPASGEEGIDMMIYALDEGYALVIIDSVVSLMPEAKVEKLEKDSTAASIGDESKMWSRNGGKIVRRLMYSTLVKTDGEEDLENGPTCIFINQQRGNVSSPTGGKTTAGGFWLRHHFSIRINITLLRKDADPETGARRVQYKINKHKDGHPARLVEANLLPEGLDQFDLLINFGKETGDIYQSGSHYYLHESTAETLGYGKKLGHGAKQVYQAWRDDPAFYEAVYNRVRQNLLGGNDG